MWEYRIERLRFTMNLDNNEDLHLVYLEDSIYKSIHVLGQAGWELVRLIGGDSPFEKQIGIFKRPSNMPAQG